MQAQVQRLSSDFEIVGIKAWDEFTGAEFNVYPGGEEAFATSGYHLRFEVSVRNNTDKWQLVYLDITVSGETGAYALYLSPRETTVHRSGWYIDYFSGSYTFKLYKDATVYQTVSAYAFRIFHVGNHHLLGDVNFDGFVNMEDLDLVKAQLGRTSGDVWGTGSDQYDPNRDLDMDGVISGRDAYVVHKLLGRWTEWDCLTHPNPSMINNGEGWTITTSDMTGETWPIADATHVSTSFYTDRRGFKHDLNIGVPGIIGGGGFVELDFTPNAHFGHNPDDWNKVLPGDIPLSQLADYKFIVEGQAHDWQHYLYDLINPAINLGPSENAWLAWCFGGWVILSKPYEIWSVQKPSGEVFLSEHNILETMFWIKQHKDGQSLMPGGNEWHRIFFRRGFKDGIGMYTGWFIVGYILGDPNVGETVQVELTGEKILQLLKTLEGKDKIYQKNPIFPNNYLALGHRDFFMKGLGFEGAYFRPVYFSLEGGVDAFITNVGVRVIGSTSFYGAYFYHKKRGIIWMPTSSSKVQVNIQ